MKTHSNNLVALAQVQLKSFYRLSIRDVTHVRKYNRPSPALLYCKRQEAGRGPGNEATFLYVVIEHKLRVIKGSNSRHVNYTLAAGSLPTNNKRVATIVNNIIYN